MDKQTGLGKRLAKHKIFAAMDTRQLQSVLDKSIVEFIAANGRISQRNTGDELLVLLDGQLKIERLSASGRTSIHIADLQMPAVITSIVKDSVITALADSRVLWLDSGIIDASIAWRAIVHSKPAIIAEHSHQIPLITQTNAFRKLTLDCVADAFARMQRINVSKGQIVVREAEFGDAYYLLDSGTADVLQTGPGETQQYLARKLKAGDGFGEESLIQKQNRNATVKMTSDGVVLRLSADDFEELVRPSLVQSIDQQKAHELMENQQVELIDCRYELEFDQYRIPGAILIPLQTLRGNINRFSRNKNYLIYCHHERRSQAAVFLLQERGIYARYIQGGIAAWPFQIDHSNHRLAVAPA